MPEADRVNSGYSYQAKKGLKYYLRAESSRVEAEEKWLIWKAL